MYFFPFSVLFYSNFLYYTSYWYQIGIMEWYQNLDNYYIFTIIYLGNYFCKSFKYSFSQISSEIIDSACLKFMSFPINNLE